MSYDLHFIKREPGQNDRDQETELECYDPQLERPLADIEPADTAGAVAMFDRVADMLGRA